MIKLLGYIKDYKKECILGPLFKLLEATFELFIPIIMAQIIDVGIIQGDKEYIINRCLIIVHYKLIFNIPFSRYMIYLKYGYRIISIINFICSNPVFKIQISSTRFR